MARTTDTLVRQIFDVDPTITDLTAFINAAHNLVNAKCTGITEENATEVETWLAAHFLGIRDLRPASETAKGVGQTYQHRVDLGLSCTEYGQMAMQLDETGGLARWNKLVLNGNTGRTAGITWLGTALTSTS